MERTRKPYIAALALAGAVFALVAFLATSNPALGEGDGEAGYLRVADASFPERPLASSTRTSSGPATGQSVIGLDERARVMDTTVYPWRAIAYLEIYDEWGLLSHSCTGTFIGPDVLLTAAHCLYDVESGWVGDIAVVPGKDGGYEPYSFQFAQQWWVPKGWRQSGAVYWDWGLVKMPSSTMGDTVGWLRVANLRDATLSAPDFTPALVGYPGDAVPSNTMWGAAKWSFLAVTSVELFYDIDTAPGQSGSAVFSANLNGPNLGDIVGIHTSGVENFNAGSRIDGELLSMILAGCYQAGCSIAYYVEPAQAPTPTATNTPLPTPTHTATPTATRSATPPPTVTATPPKPGQAKVRLPGIARD